MKQRTIWMPLLFIGIVSSLLVCISSCNKNVDNVVMADYIFENKSSHAVAITSYKTSKEITRSIKSNDSIVISLDLMFSSKMEMFNADSVIIIFDNERKVKYTPDDKTERNMMDQTNYQYALLKKNHHRFKYVISNKDYERAVLID